MNEFGEVRQPSPKETSKKVESQTLKIPEGKVIEIELTSGNKYLLGKLSPSKNQITTQAQERGQTPVFLTPKKGEPEDKMNALSRGHLVFHLEPREGGEPVLVIDKVLGRNGIRYRDPNGKFVFLAKGSIKPGQEKRLDLPNLVLILPASKTQEIQIKVVGYGGGFGPQGSSASATVQLSFV